MADMVSGSDELVILCLEVRIEAAGDNGGPLEGLSEGGAPALDEGFAVPSPLAVVPGRGIREDQRADALPLARCRSRGRRYLLMSNLLTAAISNPPTCRHLNEGVSTAGEIAMNGDPKRKRLVGWFGPARTVGKLPRVEGRGSGGRLFPEPCRHV